MVGGRSLINKANGGKLFKGSKKLLVAPGITTRNKKLYTSNKCIPTSSKKLLVLVARAF